VSRPTVSGSFIEGLLASVPSATTDPAELSRCARDWSWASLYATRDGGGPAPDVVVRATSDEDVATALRAAAEHGVPVVPRGGGSGVMGASVPHHGGVVVDLGGMAA
jgi:FAD/FMN-containing dehydrogenase